VTRDDAHGPAQAIFQPDPASVRLARAFVAEHCRSAGLCDDARDAAVLLTSEVVTNAFIHGRSEARLSVIPGHDAARVEVSDDNSRHPQMQDRDDEALDGRGLQILDLAADAWGVRAGDYGKVVWFDVVCAEHRTR
jgi:anti-sigma regulatory factor (Ser/Thr protein kinase)